MYVKRLKSCIPNPVIPPFLGPSLGCLRHAVSKSEEPGFGACFYEGYNVSGIIMIDNEAGMIKQELAWLWKTVK